MLTRWKNCWFLKTIDLRMKKYQTDHLMSGRSPWAAPFHVKTFFLSDYAKQKDQHLQCKLCFDYLKPPSEIQEYSIAYLVAGLWWCLVYIAMIIATLKWRATCKSCKNKLGLSGNFSAFHVNNNAHISLNIEDVGSHSAVLWCKIKMQYLFTLQVRIYCLLAL